jgi:hypothetical protein
MAVHAGGVNALREIEAELLEPTKGGFDSVRLAERLRAVRRMLSQQEPHWVSTTEAERLLGLDAEDTVKVWARMGLLRSRDLPDGRIQVLLDDVLHRREETEGLSAIGGDELTDEELRVMRETRPGTNPWEHERANPIR